MRRRPAIATPAASDCASAQAAFMLMVEVAILLRSWSVLISSCNVWSSSFAASFALILSAVSLGL